MYTELPATAAPSPGHEGLKPGAVAGLSIGLALGILLVATLACVGYRRKHRQRHSHTDGEASLGKPSMEGPGETEKSRLGYASRTPHFGPCSKLARPSWTIDRNVFHFSQSPTLQPLQATSRSERLPASNLVGSEVMSPSEGSSLRSPRRPYGIISVGPISIPPPSRVYRPPAPYHSNLKTYKPGLSIDPLTLSKPEGTDLKTHHVYEVM